MPYRFEVSDRVIQGVALTTLLLVFLVLLWLLGAVPWRDAVALEAFQRDFLTAVLSLASVVTLAVGVLRPSRREFTWYGVFTAALAARLIVTSGSWQPTSGVVSQAQANNACILASVGAGILFVAHFVHLSQSRAVHFLSGLAWVLAGLGLLDLGARWAAALSVLTVAGILCAVGSAGVLLIRGVRLQISGAPALALAAAMLSAVAIADLVEGRDQAALGPERLLATLVFCVVATTALVLRRMDASDWYAEVAAGARDAILVLSARGRVVEGNAAGDALLDRPIRGMLLLDAVVEADRPNAIAHMEGREHGRRAELRLRGPAGTVLHVESVAAPLPEGRQILILRDISSRRTLETSLLHAARMETAGILAGGIAHDFNNVLAALMAHIEMLRDNADVYQNHRLDKMEAVIRRATVMTRRLLAIVRGSSGAHIPVRLEDVVASAVELCGSMLPANVNLSVILAERLPKVPGNAEDLEQVILNLVLNARDAMAQTGGQIVLSAREDEGGIRLAVEDQGPGVPPGLRARIWEPFFTTKESGRGTGLGLSVVVRVVRDHGGTVDVKEGAGGRGACFEIHLPVDTDHTTLNTQRERPNARALVVDDDPDVAEMMRSELVARGCTATVAHDAAAAERAFEAASGGYDLLVTDVVLQGESGVSLARRLRARRPGLAVLVVSGFVPENEPDMDPSWQKLDKPFNAERFSAAVRRTMIAALREAGNA